MSEIIEERQELRGLRLALATRSRRWWTAVTLALGAVFGPLLVGVTTPAERTFAVVNGPVQLMMSITLPFIGVLLAADVRRGRVTAVPAVLAGLTLAAGVAVFGVVVSAASVAVAGSTVPGGGWQHAPQAALASILVLVVDQGFGLGAGAVISRPALACLGTFVPLPVWGLLTVVGLEPLAGWLTMGANAQALLAGDEPIAWVRELVVVGVWGVGFWLAGAGRLLFGHGHDAAHP